MEDNQRGDESSHSLASHGYMEGIAISESQKAEALAESREAQFHPVNEPSVPAVIEVVDKVMRGYLFAHASEPKLRDTPEVQLHPGSQGRQGTRSKRYTE